MKKFFFILLMLISLKSFSQNLVKNPGFEDLTRPAIDFSCNSTYPSYCDPFFRGQVLNWYSFVRTSNITNKIRFPQISGEAAALCITAGAGGIISFQEGIYQNGINFKKGKTYNITFKYLIDFMKSSVKLIAANNLTNTDGTVNNSNTDIETIGITPYSSPLNTLLTYTILYTPTKDYNQVALFSTYDLNISTAVSSGIMFDDIVITETCCISDKTYTNVVNPPSLNVQDYVLCNSNVTFNSNSNTNLSAKNGVTLTNNTTIDGVNSFIAQAEDCLAKPVQMFPSIVQIGCDYKFKIDACYGSGLYEFYFNEVLDSDGELIIPVGNVSITSMNFKIKDKLTQTIVTQSINVPVKRYSGNITVQALPNVITPNNDGINDYFRVNDNDKTTFAYNANKYSIQIWDRWGGLWHEEKDKMAGANGFSDTEVFWDGRKRIGTNIGACFSDGGTAYYLLTFKNCEGVNDKTYNGSITVIGCTKGLSKTGNLDDNSLVFENQQTKISPNPVNTILNIGVFSDNINITIMDMLGKEQKLDCTLLEKYNGYSTFGLDCSQLTNGIYFCNINKGEAIETIKFSVIK